MDRIASAFPFALLREGLPGPIEFMGSGTQEVELVSTFVRLFQSLPGINEACTFLSSQHSFEELSFNPFQGFIGNSTFPLL